MKAAFSLAFTLIPVLAAGPFGSCVSKTPPLRALTVPGWIARHSDPFWESAALRLHAQIDEKRTAIRGRLESLVSRTPGLEASELARADEAEIRVEGTYDHLPEVHVDHGHGSIFPQPLNAPMRLSWFQAAARGIEVLETIEILEDLSQRWENMDSAKRVRDFPWIARAWASSESRYVAYAQEVRYLATWSPQLQAHWRTASAAPPEAELLRAVYSGDPARLEDAREKLRPRRGVRRAFLPERLHPRAVLTLPIATDVRSARFLAEVEGALSTHWNQSPWARGQEVSFRIRWKMLPLDHRFRDGHHSLGDHLNWLAARSGSGLAITTGGLTTFVRGSTLVLGPGKITPRTIAHELGHLIGFPDCYIRTLSGQGFFGLAVLEWDNPIFPDDLMCDNTVGVARAEVW